MARMPTPKDPTPADDLDQGDWFPLDPDEHEAQLRGLCEMLAPQSHVLDLGAGGGRIAFPLAQAGHRVTAIDRDPNSIKQLATSNALIEARLGDFTDCDLLQQLPANTYDAALCLGHTFMLVAEPSDAVAIMVELRRIVRPGGVVVIDDFPGALWQEVADGNWQTGLSDDGAMQLVWAKGDNVLCLRTGSDIDPQCTSVREDEVRYRLWSRGELELLAHASGWKAPRTAAESYLIVFTHQD